MHDQFFKYEAVADAGDDMTKAAAAYTGLHTLIEQLLPDAIAALARQYAKGGAHSGDALLAARAQLADALWFAQEAAAVADTTGEQAAAYEGVIDYAADHMRQLLRWLFSRQFGGPRAYAPPPPATTPAGVAAAQAVGALAAAQLPAMGVSLADARWLQARGMATHALLTAALDASGRAGGAAAAANATQSAAAVVAALGGAHVADFWGARVDAARAAADPSLRALALDDRSASDSRGWHDAALGAAAALAALRQQVATADGAAAAAPAAAIKMRDGLVQFLAGVAVSANPALPDNTPADAVVAATRAAALADAALACYGGAGAPSGGAARGAACDRLASESAALVDAAFGDLGAGNVLQAAAAEGVALQWRCAARPAGGCAAVPGCARGALSSAPPAPAGGYPAVVPLPYHAEVLTCEADDSRLGLRRASPAAKAALASSAATDATCAALLQLPACETVAGGAKGCADTPLCRWLPRGARAALQGSAVGPAPADAGICGNDWEALAPRIGSPELRAEVSAANATCAARAQRGTCNALMVAMAASDDGGRGVPSSKTIALVAAAGSVVALTIGGIAFVFARRHHASRASGDGSGDGGGGIGGAVRRARRAAAGGKASKKNAMKRKVKRSEPGEYKPDLMRDSFTDYLQRPAFRTAVAIAAANMVAGDEERFVDPAAASGSGSGGSGSSGRGGGSSAAKPGLLLEPTMTFISGINDPEWPQEQDQDQQQLPAAAAPQAGPLAQMSSGEAETQALVGGRAWRRQQQQQADLESGPADDVMSETASMAPSNFSYNPFQPAAARNPETLAAARAVHFASRGDGAPGSPGGSPTSSCCHDSVCSRFIGVPPPPGSVAGSVADSVMTGVSVAGSRAAGRLNAAAFRAALDNTEESVFENDEQEW
jgi:hypothetical protein